MLTFLALCLKLAHDSYGSNLYKYIHFRMWCILGNNHIGSKLNLPFKYGFADKVVSTCHYREKVR